MKWRFPLHSHGHGNNGGGERKDGWRERGFPGGDVGRLEARVAISAGHVCLLFAFSSCEHWESMVEDQLDPLRAKAGIGLEYRRRRANGQTSGGGQRMCSVFGFECSTSNPLGLHESAHGAVCISLHVTRGQGRQILCNIRQMWGPGRLGLLFTRDATAGALLWKIPRSCACWPGRQQPWRAKRGGRGRGESEGKGGRSRRINRKQQIRASREQDVEH